MNTRENFYVETAKFAFALIGGGTAGYFLAKGANLVASKASALAKDHLGPKIAAKVMGMTGGGEQTDGGLSA